MARTDDRMNGLSEGRLAVVAIVSLFIKIALGLILPLSADEAYYWVWAKHLDYGYYDHPPMVAWLFALGKFLDPYGSAIRIPGILMGHATLMIWLAVLKNWFTADKRLIWLALFLACPMTGLGSIVITPDLPLAFFWSLAVLFAVRIWKKQSSFDYLGFGVALGLGFCSKYQIVLLPFSMAFLAVVPQFRKTFWRPPLFLTFLAGLIASSPVIGWNALHEWTSFSFQLRHGLESEGFNPRWPAEYLIGQAVLVFPAVIWAAWRADRKREENLLFAAIGTIPFIFFFLTSFRASTELNWPAMALPAIFALAATQIGKWGFRSNIGFWFVVQVLAVISIFLPGWQWHGKISEASKYKILTQLPQTHQPFFASSYQMASSLWFYSGHPVYKLRGMTRPDMFDHWDASLPPRGVFYVLRDLDEPFPKISETEEWEIRRVQSPAPGLELMEVRRP